MKNYKRIKRFGAAATAIAMLGTLSVGVFADEADVVEETVPEVVAEEVTDETVLPEVVKEVIEAPVAVEDEAEAVNAAPANLLTSAQLDITEVTATKLAIAGSTDQYNYTVNLKYKFKDGVSADGKQVAMVGYIFDGTAADAAEGTIDDAAKVYAIDQLGAASEGSFTVKMTSKSDAPKMVANDAVLILKIGSDAVADGGAQAVAVDLAEATEVLDFNAVIAKANPDVYNADFSMTLEDVKTALADTVKATVYGKVTAEGEPDDSDSSQVCAGYATKDWAVKDGDAFTGEIGSKCTFEGTVVPDNDAGGKFTEGALKVTVEVTVSALKDGDITVNVKKITEGTVISQPADCIESISIKGKGDNSGIADTIKISSTASCEWVGEALTKDSKAGTTAQIKIVIPKDVESDKGLFKLALSNDVEKTVTITVVADGKLGDANGDGDVDGLDAIEIQSYVMFDTMPARMDLSDVNKDGDVDGLDAIAIQSYVMFDTEF